MRLASSSVTASAALFDEADDVAHAQNPRRHALGMKRLELVELFADAGELDRLAGDGLHAQRRAAARVAVELGENGAGDVQRLVKMRGDVDGFLAGRGVEHEQNFLRLHEVAQAHQFLHERLVNLQTPGGVENQNVALICFREIQRLAGDFQNVRLAAFHKNRRVNLFAERFQLIHRRRTVNIRRHEQRLRPCFCNSRASLPLEVVLPEPCRPTIIMQLGLPSRFSAGIWPSRAARPVRRG